MEPLKEKCPICEGRGVVPHEKPKMENGEPDPYDLRVHDICEQCGGGGLVLVNPKTIEERQPGNIADNIGDVSG